MMDSDYRGIVRQGYDTIADEYLASRTADGDTPDLLLLNELFERLPRGARLLDAGCGAGVPVTRRLSEHFTIVGVDISESQLELARRLVSDAEFIHEDITHLSFPTDSFDAIVSYYAIIHIPRSEHRALLENFHRMLKPSGLVLLCLGANDIDDDIDDFFGTRMYWSHFDAATYTRMMEEIGFELICAKEVSDALGDEGGGHLFVLGRGIKTKR